MCKSINFEEIESSTICKMYNISILLTKWNLIIVASRYSLLCFGIFVELTYDFGHKI